MIHNITTIAFDADDTLWENEDYFRENEKKVWEILSEYSSYEEASKIQIQAIIDNIPLFGYGIKNFMLSTIQSLDKITNGTAPYSLVKQILDMGIEQINKPIVLMPNIIETLEYLKDKYRLVMATKGDLMEQKGKIKRSGLEHYFEHIHIMDNKDEENYSTLLKTINCPTENFLMIGNSMKSDVAPVINIGGYAIHIPYKTTWFFETIDEKITSERFLPLEKITQLREIL